MTHDPDFEAFMQAVQERIEFLNFAYTHLDREEYMKVLLEVRPIPLPFDGGSE